MEENTLTFSHKPEILRLHEIEDQERTKFCSEFSMLLSDFLPSSMLRRLKMSKIASQLIAICPDAYYSIVTTLRCRRRLGEEYTYIAMYKKSHYEEEGVLLNKKSRTLLVVFEILSRHLIVPSFVSLLNKKGEDSEKSSLGLFWSKIQKFIKTFIGAPEDIIVNVEWIVLMLFMLNWNKKFSIL